MDELSEAELEILREYRRVKSPNPNVVEEILAGASSTVAAPMPAVAGGARWSGKAPFLAAAAVGAAAILGPVMWGMFAARPSAPEKHESGKVTGKDAALDLSPAGADEPPLGTMRSPEAASPSGLATPRLQPPTELEPNANPNAPSRRPSARTRPQTTENTADLAAEARALQRVDDFIRDGNFESARAELSGYERQFPAGALRQEGEGLALVIACGRNPEATKARVQGFLAAHPRHVLERRIRAACPVEGGE